jgi:hypothetical protein
MDKREILVAVATADSALHGLKVQLNSNSSTSVDSGDYLKAVALLAGAILIADRIESRTTRENLGR